MKNADKWMRGLPYVGNKGQKAQQIINLLPDGERFVDAFGGGGSISLTASNSGKWDKVIYNEKRKYVVDLLKALVYDSPHIDLEKYVYITRREFFDWKDNKPDSVERTLILLSWSFSNNMTSYLWGKSTEDKKLVLTRGLFFGDTGTIYDDLFLKASKLETIREKYAFYHKWRIKNTGMSAHEDELQQLERLQWLEQLQQLEHLQRLQHLQRLEQLERLQQSQRLQQLEFINGDYRNLDIKKDDVVYCDPPYFNTQKIYGEFNNSDFDKWMNELPTDKIYISEYTVLPNTVIVADLGKKGNFISTPKSKRKSELLLKYIHH